MNLRTSVTQLTPVLFQMATLRRIPQLAVLVGLTISHHVCVTKWFAIFPFGFVFGLGLLFLFSVEFRLLCVLGDCKNNSFRARNLPPSNVGNQQVFRLVALEMMLHVWLVLWVVLFEHLKCMMWLVLQHGDHQRLELLFVFMRHF